MPPACSLCSLALTLAGVVLLAACGGPERSSAPGPADWTRRWTLDAEQSTAIDPWRGLSVVLDARGDAMVVERHWRGSREGGTMVDAVEVVPGGPAVTVALEQWPDNRHLGAYLTGDSTKTVTARWADGGRTLVTESTLTLLTQQGEAPVRIYSEYRLSPERDRLDLLELRSTRPTPLHYVFTRSNGQ
jgi:hypothetical protein